MTPPEFLSHSMFSSCSFLLEALNSNTRCQIDRSRQWSKIRSLKWVLEEKASSLEGGPSRSTIGGL